MDAFPPIGVPPNQTVSIHAQTKIDTSQLTIRNNNKTEVYCSVSHVMVADTVDCATRTNTNLNPRPLSILLPEVCKQAPRARARGATSGARTHVAVWGAGGGCAARARRSPRRRRPATRDGNPADARHAWRSYDTRAAAPPFGPPCAHARASTLSSHPASPARRALAVRRRARRATRSR